MANLWQYTALWSGFPGAPGYSKFVYANRDTQAALDAGGTQIRTFFNALITLLGVGWTVQVQQNVPYFDEVTGRLLGESAQTSLPAVVTGTSNTASWAGGTGAMVAWKTNVIWNGHRVQGRTFLVPLRGQMDVDGTLTVGSVGVINTAAQTLISSAAGDFCIWAKEFSAPPSHQQVNGTHGSVITGLTRDKTAVLRSRRD